MGSEERDQAGKGLFGQKSYRDTWGTVEDCNNRAGKAEIRPIGRSQDLLGGTQMELSHSKLSSLRIGGGYSSGVRTIDIVY